MQGVSLVPQECREQRESQDHWEPLVKMVVQAQLDPLETEDQLEPWECQDLKVSLVIQERRVNKDLLE